MKKPIIGVILDYEENGGKYSQYPWHASRNHYFDVLTELGAIPVGLVSSFTDIPAYVGLIDGLLATGGNDYDPVLYGEIPQEDSNLKIMAARSQFDLEIAKQTLEQNKPFLGICAGMQCLNILRGGALVQNLEDDLLKVHSPGIPAHTIAHAVHIEPDTKLAHLVEEKIFAVNSVHHQAIKKLGQGLQINCRSEDGLIEGIEDPTKPFCLGVQWHPECLASPQQDKALFAAFIQACTKK